MDYIINNWELLVGIIGGLHVVAKGVTMLTPTPKDDEVLAKLYKWFDFIALNIGRTKE